jgi:hypothetical protein
MAGDVVRSAVHAAVSSALADYDDRGLRALLETAEPLGTGIGGRSALLEVGGTPVFVKRVPLTDLERRPENVRSTANLFGLPTCCQYGIGAGPSFGAWRELAVHLATTDWVLDGEYPGFPLTYHWRVLPDEPPALPDELADVERVVAFWDGRPELRHRVEALREAPASLVLFLEYVPQTLHAWLTEQLAAGDETADRAVRMVERELLGGIAFMNARGLLHFDAHFENILTDGHRLYFADYGLALSSDFDLTAAEAEFFDLHRDYDRAYALGYLVNWLLFALHGYPREEREALIRALAAGAEPPPGPPAARSAIARHAGLASVVSDFLGRVQHDSRATSYPSAAIAGLLDARG